MCLAVPMKLTTLKDDGNAIVEMDGATYDVNVSLIDDPQEGDYLIVHAGFAIEKLDREEADARIELFNDLAEVQRRSAGEGGA